MPLKLTIEMTTDGFLCCSIEGTSLSVFSVSRNQPLPYFMKDLPKLFKALHTHLLFLTSIKDEHYEENRVKLEKLTEIFGNTL